MILNVSRAGRSGAVGLALIVVVVVLGTVLLLVTGDRGPLPLAALGFAAVGATAIVLHSRLVYRAARQTERQLHELERTHHLECTAITRTLDNLRFGDLVEARGSTGGLPEELERVVEGASGALGSLIEQIQGASVEVATAAQGVRETSNELASGSSQQAAAIVEITSTTEELARTAGQIAGNAARQAELAARAEEGGDAGAAALDSAVRGAESVLSRIQGIAERADSLGTRSREIYRILDLITELARETHILSLNAAIEAASAGEHGERFSAVAEEVRRLAERSRESVDSVRSLLDEFTGAIRAVVMATGEGSQAADEVLEQSRSTHGAISQLRQGFSDTARAAREISLATQEQRTASDQVVITLREVSEVVQRTADGLKRFQGAAQRLNQLALSIQLLSQSFRIDSRHSLKHLAVRWASRLTDSTGNLEAVESLLAELLRENPYLEIVYLVDRDGTMVAFAVNHDLVGTRPLPERVGVGQVYADRPWFQAVSREGRSVVTSLYDSLLTGEKCFTVAGAVRDRDSELTGMLGMDVNARNWTRI